MPTMTVITFDDLDMQQVGKRLRDARDQLGLTQDQVAWRANYTLANYNALEKGHRRDMNASTLYALCHVLGISSDYVLGLRPDLPATPELARDPAGE